MKEPKPKQDDSEIPAGDSPPQPLWPLVVGVAAWAVWLGFLVVMMVFRLHTTAV
ncbi:MAG: hypothetical protein KAV82_00975 [Phycisphaerae bacterium]|nr:hypothetical protein [Phycisphaerae bacterium]